MKLEDLLAKHRSMGKRGAKRCLSDGIVRVDGMPAADGRLDVDRFAAITAGEEVIQPGGRALYIMLHKPAGVVSATIDALHPTVIDLIDDPDKGTLHLAGRLDRATTGLLLLTNDGRWSKRITLPERKVAKVYLVETMELISSEAVAAFFQGFHFHTEDIFTAPAALEILDHRRARLTLYEGRYHQVKRMFHRVGNRVVSLHRESVGGIMLPGDLRPGEWRELTPAEVAGA